MLSQHFGIGKVVAAAALLLLAVMGRRHVKEAGLGLAQAEAARLENAQQSEEKIIRHVDGRACDERLSGTNDINYRGCQTKTVSGALCQKWSTQKPHAHSRTPDNYLNTGLGDHNYCRNPDGEVSIWCYTTDPKIRWEYCRPYSEGLSGGCAAGFCGFGAIETTFHTASCTTKTGCESDSACFGGQGAAEWCERDPARWLPGRIRKQQVPSVPLSKSPISGWEWAQYENCTYSNTANSFSIPRPKGDPDLKFLIDTAVASGADVVIYGTKHYKFVRAAREGSMSAIVLESHFVACRPSHDSNLLLRRNFRWEDSIWLDRASRHQVKILATAMIHQCESNLQTAIERVVDEKSLMGKKKDIAAKSQRDLMFALVTLPLGPLIGKGVEGAFKSPQLNKLLTDGSVTGGQKIWDGIEYLATNKEMREIYLMKAKAAGKGLVSKAQSAEDQESLNGMVVGEWGTKILRQAQLRHLDWIKAMESMSGPSLLFNIKEWRLDQTAPGSKCTVEAQQEPFSKMMGTLFKIMDFGAHGMDPLSSYHGWCNTTEPIAVRIYRISEFFGLNKFCTVVQNFAVQNVDARDDTDGFLPYYEIFWEEMTKDMRVSKHPYFCTMPGTDWRSSEKLSGAADCYADFDGHSEGVKLQLPPRNE